MNQFIEFKGHYFDPAAVIRVSPVSQYNDRWPVTVWFSEPCRNNNGSAFTVFFDTQEKCDAGIMEIMAAVNKAKDVSENSSGKKIFAFVSPTPKELVNELVDGNKCVYVVLVAKNKEEALDYLKIKSGELTYDWYECDPATALENSSCCVFRRN